MILSAAYPYSDQTSSLFDKQSKCTCHYFVSQNQIQTTNNTISRPLINVESCPEMKYILTVDDFCFWYDVRSALLDVIDRVVAMDETPASILRQIPSKRRGKRPKTSIAIQTSHDNDQRRNAKVQANTVTLFPSQRNNLSSSNLFLN